ncbi:MAG: hypothetical protein B6D64_13615 [Bacteroidetes bacterium 4484_276]|nr:MAG: hypothetical protein B6D64_13615 [Bacteroidetes bacterium 4484_276]
MIPEQLINRIEINPGVLAGKPVIKGTRLSVQYILGLLASGADIDEVLTEYSTLGPEDIQACLLFASNKNNSHNYIQKLIRGMLF